MTDTLPPAPAAQISHHQRFPPGFTASCIACHTEVEHSRRRRLTRGLCAACYQRHRKLGTIEQVALPKQSSSRTHQVGERYLDGEGYVKIRLERGIQPEHRIVMEQVLGRRLVRGENVHHINGVRHDNRPENLELWYRPQPSGQRVTEIMLYLTTYHREQLLELLIPQEQK